MRFTLISTSVLSFLGSTIMATGFRTETVTSIAPPKPTDNNEMQVVKDAIEAWRTDIIIINTFLDSCTKKTPDGHGTNRTGVSVPTLRNITAQDALKASRDELIQLDILDSVHGLDEAGKDAAQLLGGLLPNITAAFELLAGIKGEDSSKSKQERTKPMNKQRILDMINHIRCQIVLPAIDALWKSASAAVMAPKPPSVPIPKVCGNNMTQPTTTSTIRDKTHSPTKGTMMPTGVDHKNHKD